MVYVMSTHAPTRYQSWLNPALKKSGLSLATLAVKAGMNYTALWKIARGNPVVYPGSSRPEYTNAVKIGELLGDVEGSLKAARYIEDPSTSDITAGDTASKYDAAIIAALPRQTNELKQLILSLMEKWPSPEMYSQSKSQ